MAFSQEVKDDGIQVVQFNAEWNNANGVGFLNALSDCGIEHIDIGINKEAQKKYGIAVVPTIIIFQDGEEAKRFQADLSFKMTATKEDVQEAIDEILMSDF